MNNSKIKKMRIPVELRQLQKSQNEHGISCNTLSSSPDDFTALEAYIPGPKGSPYEEGTFKMSITFGEQYPFRPPTFKFITPVYHPNIDSAGKICLDLLRMPPTGSYNPAITLESILLSIQLLLANPNPDDPLQGDAADLFKSNRDLYNQKAREFVKQHSCLHEDMKVVDSGEVKENDVPSGNQEVKKKKLKLSYK
ncbi:probable ubiquitin-conjugating enzyme E2 31 [Lucilia cuprina]|uniref:probable ubiquitin-conjugating enzyme E2 31 n=1 Tax=Lucilia cuprina TaxID=7375 RepID=UPI001F059A5F|nr:probable ubiquitin-conjugating enzyme E2 31 [Lucilia cuprina]